MRVSFRPTVAADLALITHEPLPHRIKAITAVIPDDEGERVIGLGGIGYRPDGTVIAFAQFTDAMRKYPAAVHRAGLLGMGIIRRSGAPIVVAQAQPGNPAAERWLERFGFVRIETPEGAAYVWRRSCANAD